MQLRSLNLLPCLLLLGPISCLLMGMELWGGHSHNFPRHVYHIRCTNQNYCNFEGPSNCKEIILLLSNLPTSD